MRLKDRWFAGLDEFAPQESSLGWLACSSRVRKELWHLPPRLQFDSPFSEKSFEEDRMENEEKGKQCAWRASAGSGIAPASAGDHVWVRWETKWAPETGGWSAGVVKEVSHGRTKNPNGPGLVTGGWSVVEYPENELHIHHLDAAHHVDVIGDTEMAWRHVAAHCGNAVSVDPGSNVARRERPSRLAYGQHRKKRRRKKSSCGSSNAGSQDAVTDSACEPPDELGVHDPNENFPSNSQSDQIDEDVGALADPSETKIDEDDEGSQDVDGFYEFSYSLQADFGSQATPPQASLRKREDFLPAEPRGPPDKFQLCDPNSPALRDRQRENSRILCLGSSVCDEEDDMGVDLASRSLAYNSPSHPDEIIDVAYLWQPAASASPAGAVLEGGEQSSLQGHPGARGRGSFTVDNYPFTALEHTIWGTFDSDEDEDDSETSRAVRRVEYVVAAGETPSQIANRLDADGCTITLEEFGIGVDWDTPLAHGTVVQLEQDQLQHRRLVGSQEENAEGK